MYFPLRFPGGLSDVNTDLLLVHAYELGTSHDCYQLPDLSDLSAYSKGIRFMNMLQYQGHTLIIKHKENSFKAFFAFRLIVQHEDKTRMLP